MVKENTELKSKIKFSPVPKESYDGEKIDRLILDEVGLTEQYKPEIDVKAIEQRIKDLEAELKKPPPNPQIGLRAWTNLRTNELNKLKKQLI